MLEEAGGMGGGTHLIPLPRPPCHQPGSPRYVDGLSQPSLRNGPTSNRTAKYSLKRKGNRSERAQGDNVKKGHWAGEGELCTHKDSPSPNISLKKNNSDQFIKGYDHFQWFPRRLIATICRNPSCEASTVHQGRPGSRITVCGWSVRLMWC